MDHDRRRLPRHPDRHHANRHQTPSRRPATREGARFRLRTLVPLPGQLHCRLSAVRRRLEERFRIRIGEDDFTAYVVEKAVERLEEWEQRLSG